MHIREGEKRRDRESERDDDDDDVCLCFRRGRRGQRVYITYQIKMFM